MRGSFVQREEQHHGRAAKDSGDGHNRKLGGSENAADSAAGEGLKDGKAERDSCAGTGADGGGQFIETDGRHQRAMQRNLINEKMEIIAGLGKHRGIEGRIKCDLYPL